MAATADRLREFAREHELAAEHHREMIPDGEAVPAGLAHAVAESINSGIALVALQLADALDEEDE